MTTIRATTVRPTGLTGAAGEYFVAAELSLRGWLATVTIKNAPGTDVLARDLATGSLVAIQTKTASVGNTFTLGVKDERPTATTNEWYVLVALREPGHRPSFYVLPRNDVAGLIYVQNRHWLAKPSRSGRPHKDEPRRVIRAKYIDEYRERWELLKEPTTAAPLLLPAEVVELAKRFGLPEEHPGWIPIAS